MKLFGFIRYLFSPSSVFIQNASTLHQTGTKSILELEIEKQVLLKYNIRGKLFLYMGRFDLKKISYEQIKGMITSTELNEERIKSLAFDDNKTLNDSEIYLYKIDNDVYITFQDTSELWDDPKVLDLFKRL